MSSVLVRYALPFETAASELLGKIHQALQHFSAGNYAPLFRTNLKKVMVNSSYECYRLIYQTAFEDGFDTGATTSRIQGVRLNLK